MDPLAFERHLVPVLFRPLAGALLAAGPPTTGRRVLDVACGTGVVSRLVVDTAASVTGVDVDPAVLALAAELEPRVTWVQGDAVALPLPDGAFDVAVCQQGLQYVGDPAAALGELRRVLAPGGVLGLALWCDVTRAPGFHACAEVLERQGGPGDLMRRPFALHAGDDVRALVTGAGFGDVRAATCLIQARFPSVRAFFEQQAAASPLAAPVAGMTPAAREATVRDLQARLAGRLDDDGLSFPVESHLLWAVAGAVGPAS
jgi:SAM-dependent methyltransferase